MRDELELIEKIEQYLTGKLTRDEALAFEQQIAGDISLNDAVSAQRDIMQGIARASVRQDVQHAGRHYHSGKQFTRWGVFGAVGLIIVAMTFFLVKKQHWLRGKDGISVPAYSGTMLPVLNEHGINEWATADSIIPAQVFEIDAAKDTVIETTGGIVLAIPAHAFMGKDRAAVSGKISLCIKEALDPLTIMRARLSTMSGGKLLETGGMFFIDVRQGDDILRINPTNGIYAEIPNDNPKAEMQIFSGKRMPGGRIDWVNPVPLPNDLVSVDINSLDFYPPEYLHMLNHAGYPVTSKNFTDSVYYSLASLFHQNDAYDRDGLAERIASDSTGPPEDQDTARSLGSNTYSRGETLFRTNCATCHNPLKDATGPALGGKSTSWSSRNWVYDWVRNPAGMIAKGDRHALAVFAAWKPTIMTRFPKLKNEEIDAILKYVDAFDGMCGINPAKIKAIWNSKFQNTLLATREFEQRMKLIHASKDPTLLDLYMNNLDKNLYQIDSMVAAVATDGRIIQAFRNAASLRNGKVRNGSKQFDQLRAYYAQKTQLFTEAIAATQFKIRTEQERTDNDAGRKVLNKQTGDAARVEMNFEQELALNLESAYKQLGKPRPSNALATTNSSHTVLVTNTGWNNVDRYVLESTTNRNTLDYTDPESGKKAVIEYKPISVSIGDAQSYDRVLVYLLPDQLSSFMNLQEVSGKFSEKLNGLMKYDLVCIGLKGSQTSLLHLESVQAKAYENLKLKAIDSSSLKNTLNQLRMVGQANAMRKEIEYALWDVQLIAQRQQRQKWQVLIDGLKRNLFSCDVRIGSDEPDLFETEISVK